MKTIKFDGFEEMIADEELSQDIIEVLFGGHMIVQFEKQQDGAYKPINAADRWGRNCFKEIKDKEAIII